MANDEKTLGLPPDHGVAAARDAAPDPGRTAPMPPRTEADEGDPGGGPDEKIPPRPGGGADVNDRDTLEPASDRFLGIPSNHPVPRR